jgi:hypothetical protein
MIFRKKSITTASLILIQKGLWEHRPATPRFLAGRAAALVESSIPL